MQSRKVSLGLAAGAIAVAVVLFAVLKHNGGDSSSATTGLTKITFKDGAPVGGVRTSRSPRATRSASASSRTSGRGPRARLRHHEGRQGRRTAQLRLPGDVEGIFEAESLESRKEQTPVRAEGEP